MTDTLQTQVHGQIHENTSEFPNKFLYMYMDNLLPVLLNFVTYT